MPLPPHTVMLSALLLAAGRNPFGRTMVVLLSGSSRDVQPCNNMQKMGQFREGTFNLDKYTASGGLISC